MTILLMAVAGGLGAACRFLLDGVARSLWRTAVPIGTLAINITGSLALGFVTGLALHHLVPAEVQLVVGTGFLGGYTTFSTASFETVRLLQERRWAAALMSGLGMLVLTIAAAAAGLALASLL